MLTKTVRSEIFCNAVSEWWVRRNVAPDKRLRLGHSTVAWYEDDVRDWLDSRPNC
jgi:predicted DNA-binding transcriptional regulator AlpA